MKTIGKTHRALLAPPILALVLAAPACGPGPGGDDDDDTGSGTEEGPTCTWEKVYDGDVKWIEGFSADEIYAMTEDEIIRWDGSEWTSFFAMNQGQPISSPFVDEQRVFYFGAWSDGAANNCVFWKYESGQWTCIWTDSAGDIVAAGGPWGTAEGNDIYTATGVSAQQSIYQYDPSGGWTEMWTGNASVNRIWGRGAEDIYAIGMGFGESHAMHYDGTDWKPLPPITGLPGGGYGVSLLDMAIDSSNALFFVGEDDWGESDYPILAKFDGATWEIVIDKDDVHQEPDEEYQGNLTSIHFFDDGKAMAVGYELAYFYDGTKWWDVTPYNFGGSAVWGVSALDFHMAGLVGDGLGIFRASCE
jgi:hypothetical protein